MYDVQMDRDTLALLKLYVYRHNWFRELQHVHTEYRQSWTVREWPGESPTKVGLLYKHSPSGSCTWFNRYPCNSIDPVKHDQYCIRNIKQRTLKNTIPRRWAWSNPDLVKNGHWNATVLKARFWHYHNLHE